MKHPRSTLQLFAKHLLVIGTFACLGIGPRVHGKPAGEEVPATLPVEFSRPVSPFLIMTKDEIAVLRTRVKTQPWASEAAARIQAEAEEILKQPNPFPDQEAGWGHRFGCPKCGARLTYDKLSPHKHLCQNCQIYFEGPEFDQGYRYCAMMAVPGEQRTLAVAYLITGDKRYAEGLAASFRDVAAKYARFRLHDNQMRFDPERVAARTWCGGLAHSQWIDECSMLTAMLPSYDVLLGSGLLTQEEQDFIEKNLWAKALEYLHLIKNKRGSGANWDIWANSCMVMLGIAFEDKNLVDEGINSPKYGLLSMLRRGYFNQDGFIGELSPGYHAYVMEALFRVFPATRRAGIALDELAPFQRMLDLPAKISFPNSMLPVMGDSRKTTINPLYYELGWNWYRRPEYARVLAEYYATQTDRNKSATALLYGPDELPEPAPLRESTILSDTMLAVLRSPCSDWHALLKCDKGIGGHRHPDAMNLHLYANGEEAIPGTGTPEYNNPLVNEWYRQTISHSTMVLNTRTQAMWQRTKNQRLEFALSRWGASAVQMSVEGVQADPTEHPARLRRLIAMTPHGLIDIFRVESVQAAGPPGDDSVNLLDCILHLRGTLALPQPSTPWQSPLIPQERLEAKYDLTTKRHPHEGYKWFTDIRKITTPGPIQARLTQPRGGIVDLWLAAGDTTTEVFVMKSPGGGGSIDQKHTTLLQRRSANDTAFASFYAPHKGEPQVESVRFEKIAGDGTEVAMAIVHKDGTDIILSRVQEGSLEAAGAKLNGTFGCGVVLPEGARQVMLVGKQWQEDGMEIRLKESRAIIVDVQSGKVRLYNASGEAAVGALRLNSADAEKTFEVSAGQSVDL